VADRFGHSVVPQTATIRDALVAVDRGAAGICLAVDDAGRLVGVATDGDLRRAILAGAHLADPLAPVLNPGYAALGRGHTRNDALDLMRARHIDAVPSLDDEGRPVALHLLHAVLEPEPRTNWAVIMAGGRGTRLRPLTDNVPKPMLRVAGRPILERIVLHLVGSGIRRIFISVGYLGDMIEAHFGDGHAFGTAIEYLREPTPLGTAGALGMLPSPPTEPLLVLNGDLVTSVDVEALLGAHDRGGHAATIGTRRYVHSVPFGCVERDGDRVVAIDEKPAITREVNTGIYVLSPLAVALVERGVPTSMPELLEELLRRGEAVGAFEVEDDWIDVGQRDQLVAAREGGHEPA
jgi:dTDP-glucose pyrophosphorylase